MTGAEVPPSPWSYGNGCGEGCWRCDWCCSGHSGRWLAISSSGAAGLLLLLCVAWQHGSQRLWQEEWERTLLDVALKRVYERVSDRCRKAFELFALNRQSAEDVGKQLGMQPNTVYASKHRVTQYLREEIAILKKECEDLES